MRMRSVSAILVLVADCLCVRAAQPGLTYGGVPYDLCKANWMAANYLQALTSPRWEATAFAHDRFGDAEGRGGLYFVDDQGRVIACFAAEAEFGPVARVESVAALARGILRARVPGSEGRYFVVIDGRQAQYLRPEDDRFSAYWLQDSSLPFCSVRALTGDGRPALQAGTVERLPEVMDAVTTYTGKLGETAVTATNTTSVRDLAPALEFTAPRAGPLDLVIAPKETWHFLHAGKPGRLKPEEADQAAGASWLLLEQEAKLVTSDKAGWEAPAVWERLNSMVLVTCDPPPDRVRQGPATDKNELTVSWQQAKTVRLRFGLFAELDPGDCDFVFRAARRVAKDGQFGCQPYLPVRPSNNLLGSVVGLSYAAWMLRESGHVEAPMVKAAAIEALQAVVASEERGYYGSYQWNAIRAAFRLRRLAPDAIDYDHWARVWADRELPRRPPGWKSAPWSDTALRAMQTWHYAWLITGDAKYKQLRDESMAEFSLPAKTPYDGFEWRGKSWAFDGYDCLGAAMLLGAWGELGDSRAQTMVTGAGPRYFNDFGFTPYRTWTADDLLPYYVGYSLRSVYPERKGLGKPRALKADEFASYDANGQVTLVSRPAMPTAP